MSPLRIHLEPVGELRTQLEVGRLQRARHRSRPLLTGCGSHQHGLARCHLEPDSAVVQLRCRSPQDAQTAAVLARRALATLAPLRRLLDLRPSDHITVQDTAVHIASDFPRYAVRRLLDSVKALPDVPDGSPSPAAAIDFVEYSGPDAIAAFERGDLQATAPSSLEIARDCASHARFRPSELDVFVLLLVGPGRPERHSIVRHRRALRHRLAAEVELADRCLVVADDDAGADADAALEPTGVAGGEATLLYADFWPNAAIVRAVSSALGELGVTARPQSLPLGELHSRTSAGSYDLALVLANGYAGPHLSMPLTLARSAALGPFGNATLRDALAHALTGPEDGPAWPAVTAAALPRVPAVPLARLRGGSLLDPALPHHPLAYGCVLPLEHYVGGCSA